MGPSILRGMSARIDSSRGETSAQDLPEKLLVGDTTLLGVLGTPGRLNCDPQKSMKSPSCPISMISILRLNIGGALSLVHSRFFGQCRMKRSAQTSSSGKENSAIASRYR